VTRREEYLANRESEIRRGKSWYWKNRDRAIANRKKYALTFRAEMFSCLGSACACCGYNDKRFLSLDHINNDGWKERNTRRSAGIVGQKLAKKLGWDKTRYQILCFNCNLAKGFNKGVCPHRQSLSTVDQSL